MSLLKRLGFPEISFPYTFWDMRFVVKFPKKLPFKEMDPNPFKLDIDELISEFVECGSTTFAEFKRVWLSRKFTFMFEAKPSTKKGFFMQSLYAHCLGYLISAGSLSNRLGGLFCLYCLYETQPFKPPFKIYLSLGELRHLKNFVTDTKLKGLHVVSALMKRMLEKNTFLFGFVGVNEGSATARVNELTDLQNAQVQAAYKKLFADSSLEHFIHMDMDMELDVKSIKKMSSDYALAKELSIKEASQVVDVENIKHIAEKKQLIGDMVERTAEDWESQKELFYEQTRFAPLPITTLRPEEENGHSEKRNSAHTFKQKETCDNPEKLKDENFQEDEDIDGFGKELEDALSYQPMECEDEGAKLSDSWDEDAYSLE